MTDVSLVLVRQNGITTVVFLYTLIFGFFETLRPILSNNHVGCLPFTKSFRKIRLVTKFLVVPAGNSGSDGTSGKVVLFFRTECSQRNFFKFFFFSELSLTLVSGLRGRFIERESNCTNVKRDSGGKFFSVPNFAHHLTKP